MSELFTHCGVPGSWPPDYRHIGEQKSDPLHLSLCQVMELLMQPTILQALSVHWLPTDNFSSLAPVSMQCSCLVVLLVLRLTVPSLADTVVFLGYRLQCLNASTYLTCCDQ